MGSITALVDSSGTIVNTYRYDSFGGIISKTGTLEQPFTYTGREYDEDTGLFYYRARYYDPHTGRFLQEDPIWNTNLYVYVYSNPLKLIDPSGLHAGVVYLLQRSSLQVYIEAASCTLSSFQADIRKYSKRSIEKVNLYIAVFAITNNKQKFGLFVETYGPRFSELTRETSIQFLEIIGDYFHYHTFLIREDDPALQYLKRDNK